MIVNKGHNNLVRLGDYITQRREKNDYLDVPIRGVTNSGFIPPKQLDADTSLYNVFYKNDFVFNPARMELNSISLNLEYDQAICSSLYEIFYVNNTEELLPEYLNLFIKRDEFARFCWYDAIGSARNYFRVANLQEIRFPLPEPDIQQELVDTYNGLKALAEQNEALIKPLTDACRAYISECKKKYDESELGKVINQRREKYSGTQSLPIRGVSNDGFIPPKQKDADLSKYNVFYKDDFVFNPARMELNSIALNTDLDKGICSSLYEVFSVDSSAVLPEYLNLFIKRSEFARQCEYIGFGSAREYCRVNNISEIKFPLPPPEVQQAIVNLYNCAEEAKKIASEAREKMKTLCPALVQKAING
jgi:type I restriction enzyme S subunit